MAASKDSVELLHTSLCNAFTELLDNGVKALDKEGNLVTLTAPAPYLSVIRQFIKDNGVQADPKQKGSAMESVVTSLPYPGDDAHVEH